MSILIFSTMVILFSVMSNFVSIDSPLVKLILIGLIILLALFFILMLFYVISDYKDNDEYFKRKTKYEMIVQILIKIKILRIEDKLLIPLIQRIDLDFKDGRIFQVKNTKDFIEYENRRLNEYLSILSKLLDNKNIL